MKTRRVFYWIFTCILGLFMLFSSYMYLSKNPMMIDSFHKTLGYPLYFITFLGVAKALGVIGLLQQNWKTLQEWSYAGFTFTFLGAIWTHHSTGSSYLFPLIALVLLFFSYILRKKGR
jgi:hypothetical protein